MKTWVFYKLRCNILIRTHLLNLFLLLFPTSNKFIIALSQNLDKYIVLYQKKLVSLHSKKDKSKYVKEVAA